MAETYYWAFLRDDGETEVQVEIAVNSWGRAAQLYGPPEACDPGEPMEVEVLRAWLWSDRNTPLAPCVILTEAEIDRAEIEFMENPPEDDDGFDG
jgi:hypothetical protein